MEEIISRGREGNEYLSRGRDILLSAVVFQRRMFTINHHFLAGISELLGIETLLSWSTGYASVGGPSERLISICKQADAEVYVTGPAAKKYLDIKLFEEHGVKIEWMNYEGYQEYPQIYGEFERAFSVIDLLFNTGKDATSFMKSREYEVL